MTNSIFSAFNGLRITDKANRADIPIPSKQTFDPARRPPVLSSEIGPPQQPQALLERTIREIETRSHQQRGGQLLAQVDDAITEMRGNIEEVTRIQGHEAINPEE